MPKISSSLVSRFLFAFIWLDMSFVMHVYCPLKLTFFFLLLITYLPGALIKTCQWINTSKISVIKDYLNADS